MGEGENHAKADEHHQLAPYRVRLSPGDGSLSPLKVPASGCSNQEKHSVKTALTRQHGGDPISEIGERINW